MIGLLALIAAIILTVLAFVFIVPEKRRELLNKFGKFLHDTANFKYLIIEKILQALYIFLTIYVILVGFFMLFSTQTRFDYYNYRTYNEWAGGYGLLVMIFGPIVVRLAYEGVMMFILLVKNVIQINSKLKSANGEPAAEAFSEPVKQPEETTAPAKKAFCANCGAPVGEGTFCNNCGAKLQ